MSDLRQFRITAMDVRYGQTRTLRARIIGAAMARHVIQDYRHTHPYLRDYRMTALDTDPAARPDPHIDDLSEEPQWLEGQRGCSRYAIHPFDNGGQFADTAWFCDECGYQVDDPRDSHDCAVEVIDLRR